MTAPALRLVRGGVPHDARAPSPHRRRHSRQQTAWRWPGAVAAWRVSPNLDLRLFRGGDDGERALRDARSRAGVNRRRRRRARLARVRARLGPGEERAARLICILLERSAGERHVHVTVGPYRRHLFSVGRGRPRPLMECSGPGWYWRLFWAPSDVRMTRPIGPYRSLVDLLVEAVPAWLVEEG